MRLSILLSVMVCSLSFGQTNRIVLSTISHPKQKDFYPPNYWKVWVNDLPRTENAIKNPNSSRRVRAMEYFNRFLLYVKMQTNTPDELFAAFMDSYQYAPHYTIYRYKDALPLRGKEYGYMWNAFGNEKNLFDSICQQTMSSYDTKLMDRLSIIRERDQRYRKKLETRSLHKLKADGSWEKQITLDKENSKEIRNILDKIGYPGRSKVSFEHESTVFLVIQHSNPELMEYGLPFIKKAIQNLDLRKSYYAFLYDRIQLVKKLPQLYGTQYNLDGSLYQLEQPETVNACRQELGLHPIKVE